MIGLQKGLVKRAWKAADGGAIPTAIQIATSGGGSAPLPTAYASVSWYYDGTDQSVTTDCGVYPSDEWTFMSTTNTSAQSTVDQDGAASPIEAASSFATRVVPDSDDTTEDGKLFYGCGVVAQSGNSIAVTGVPYTTYAIVVFCDSKNSLADGEWLGVTVDGTTKYTAGNNLGKWQLTYIQDTAEATGDASATANYILFTGLTGEDQTITLTSSAFAKVGVSAVQVVDTATPPPPAFLLLESGDNLLLESGDKLLLES